MTKGFFTDGAVRLAATVEAAGEIAGDLGAGWGVEPVISAGSDAVQHVCLSNVDGRRISLVTEEYLFKGQVQIIGVYDYGEPKIDFIWPYGKARPSIKVGLARGGHAIAGEIKRRFLPAYDEVFNEISLQVAERRNSKAKKEAMAAELAAIAGPAGNNYGAGDSQFRVRADEVQPAPAFSWLAVECSSSDVSLMLHGLPVEIAGAVLRLVLGARGLLNPAGMTLAECAKVRDLLVLYFPWLTDRNLEAEGSETVDEVAQLFRYMGGEVVDFNPDFDE